MFWNKEMELIERPELEKLQLKLLRETLEQAAKSEFYSRIITPDFLKKFHSLKDIEALPFIAKPELREHFPYGFLAEPLENIVRLHSSSGTTGNPTVVFHTKEDLFHWTDLTSRSLYMAGLRKSDVFQNIMGYGLFTGGLGMHYAAENVGALVIPSAAGNSKRQIWFMDKFRTTACHILPSYAMRLYSFFPECGIDPKKDLALRMFFIGAEHHSEELRQQIQEAFGVKAFNSYGLSEMCGPGLAFECPFRNGMHLWEDHYYMEIIDPDTCEVLPDGEEGELVLTSLRRKAMPLIRYRTHDLTRILPEPCPCGRTHRRLERMKGRSDDMLILNGVNIFPLQIERAVMSVPDVGSNYLIEITKDDFLDRIHIKVEVNAASFTGSLEAMDSLRKNILEAVRTELGVTPRVELLEPNSLPPSEGKAKRVLDLRRNEYKKTIK